MIHIRSVAILFSICVGSAMSALTGAAHAEAVDDTGVWLALFADGDIESQHSDRWKWWFDGHLRFFDDADGFGQSLVRPGVGYQLGESATLWAGYAWIHTSPEATPAFDEHRIWQQATWSNEGCGSSLSYRSRLEQRFVETGSDTGWRFRQLFAARRPLALAPRLTLVAWDEIFMNLNDTDWGAVDGFDQNRAFAGLGFKADPRSPVRIEAGYLNQYVHRSTAADASNHLLSINLFWSR